MAEKYVAEQKSKYNEKCMAILEELPPFCTGFLLSMHDTTQPRTRHGYLMDLKLFFYWITISNPQLKDKPMRNISLDCLNNLNQDDIREFLVWLEDYELDGRRHHNDRAGKKRKLSSVRKLYDYLTSDKDIISNNPAIKVKQPKLLKKDIRVLDDDERIAIFEAIENEKKEIEKAQNDKARSGRKHGPKSSLALLFRDKAIVYMFLGSGLRISELAGLDMGDIKVDQGRVNIIRKRGKHDHIYISDETMTALLTYADGGSRAELLGDNDEEDAIFISNAHTRMTPRSIERIVKKYAEKALGTSNGITPHILRKTFGTQYYEATHDILATADVLGHESVETTKRHYVHSGEQAKREMRNINIYGNNSDS